jgi:hypothetical protein
MIDTNRQLASPSATAWSIDLEAVGGPEFVVLRLDPDAAREALAKHLVEIGSIPNAIEAGRIVGAAPARHVGVVW